MKKAAIYCRVSTDGQEREGTSLDTQEKSCRIKARELGYELSPNCILRETYSGLSLERPLLNNLRLWVRERKIDLVIAYTLDRLSRDPVHFIILQEELERAGVSLVFVSEDIDSSDLGKLILHIRGYAAKLETEKIKERTLRGKREKCRQGKLATGGGKLYGYDFGDGKRTINQSESQVVSRVFGWFAHDSYTLYQATAYLNKLGIPSPRGSRWNWGAVYHLLTNPAYKGETYAFRYKMDTGKIRIREKAEWIEVPDATPPIVTPAIWNMTQEQLRQNRLKSPRNRKHSYLLTNGRLRCGVCGRSMIGACQKKGNGEDRLFYRCICNVKSSYYDKCPQHSIAASRVESLVWNEVAKVLRKPGLIIAELKRRGGRGRDITIEAEEILIQKRIKTLSKEEGRYLRLYGQGKFDETTLSIEVERTRRDRLALEESLAELGERRRVIVESAKGLEQVSKVLAVINNRLNGADFNLKKLALDALDISATLYPDNTLHINGFIPREMQLSSGKSQPFVKQFSNAGYPFSLPVKVEV